MKTKVFFIAAALVAMTGLLSAQKADQKSVTNNPQRGAYYVDADNNGKCDNFEKGKGGNNPKGDGIRLRDGSGRENGKGRRMGNRQGLRDGKGNGNGRFVDTNNNGICDRRE
ncbi:MAG: hypothetical protein PHQ11_05950 [Paludibacter sp.]|nr:hypothetical protein [Paludibacter sp.]MDD4199609.1 hypothetical protein [Paludibacter sp.]MDD4428523.1 hypothetical protein [Paludibacter sp.]